MKKIGFIGAYDKSDLIIYVAKILQLLNYKVMVIDTTLLQKTKYIVPSINPTKSYITSFEDIDFAIGFKNWDDIEKYLGIKFDTNEEETKKDTKGLFDYILIDIDSQDGLERFGIDELEEKYFVTSFDMYSLRRGIRIFESLDVPIKLTKILFSYESSQIEEEQLNYASLGYKIEWNDFTIYFPISDEDNKVMQENQRFEKIRFKRLSNSYKESLAYIIQDIDKSQNLSKIRKTMKD